CCYDAKKKGRDRVELYRPEAADVSAIHDELQVVSQINQAFELGRFRLYRQRIVPLSSGVVEPYRPEAADVSAIHDELQVVSQINQAFELGRFRLYRQRIVPLSSGVVE